MNSFKTLFIFITISLFYNNLRGQSNDSSTLIRGIYKSYNEFLTNSPSLKDAFDVKYYSKEKNDPTIISAEFILTDSSKSLNNVWGFCDGRDVFIRYPHNLLGKRHYWKLEHMGKRPFFTYIYKTAVGVGGPLLGLVTLGVTAALSPKEYVPALLNEKGKVKDLDIDLVKKYLKPHQELYKSFCAEIAPFIPESNDDDYFETDEAYAAKVILMKKYLLKLDSIE